MLVSSIAYYLLSGNGILILYPLAACLTAYAGIFVMGRTSDGRKRRTALVFVILLLIGSLFVLKYINFGINTINGVMGILGWKQNVISGFHFLIPLGISFYTFDGHQLCGGCGQRAAYSGGESLESVVISVLFSGSDAGSFQSLCETTGTI